MQQDRTNSLHSEFAECRRRSEALVCGMNLAFVEGLVAGLGIPGVEARLAPRPDSCCVALRSASAKPAA